VTRVLLVPCAAWLQELLPFVKECKQSGLFKEKLCQRFEALHEDQAATAADMAAAEQAAREAEEQRRRQQQAREQAGAEGAAAAPAGAAEGEGQVVVKPEPEEQAGPVGVQPPQPAASAAGAAAAGPSGATQQQQEAQSSQQGAQGAGGGDLSPVVKKWRALSFMLGELGYAEKDTRRTMELLRSYKHALGDKVVFTAFWVSDGGLAGLAAGEQLWQ
jgi:hypothetical protein